MFLVLCHFCCKTYLVPDVCDRSNFGVLFYGRRTRDPCKTIFDPKNVSDIAKWRTFNGWKFESHGNECYRFGTKLRAIMFLPSLLYIIHAGKQMKKWDWRAKCTYNVLCMLLGKRWVINTLRWYLSVLSSHLFLSCSFVWPFSYFRLSAKFKWLLYREA